MVGSEGFADGEERVVFEGWGCGSDCGVDSCPIMQMVKKQGELRNESGADAIRALLLMHQAVRFYIQI